MTIRVAWSASIDPNIATYKVQRSADKVTWSADLATITHNLGNSAVYDTVRALFYWDDAIGTTGTWYHVKAIDSLAQESSWSPAFRAALTCDETELRLCNQALSRIGITRQLATYEEATIEGQECRLWYPTVLKELQSCFRWPWAIRREALTLTAVTASDYTYVYSLPEDCFHPLRLAVESDPNPRYDERQPFLVEGGQGYLGLLMCDLENAELIYIAWVDNVCYFPPQFKKALVLGIASHLAASLKKDEQLAERLGAESQAALRVAMALAANQGQPEPSPISGLEASRR